ncbi:MAG: DUF2974 domain-containing protein [Eubacterium sp.]
MNILDYLKWRGDLSFKNNRFNEIDNLVLSSLAYLPIECVMTPKETITIQQSYQRSLDSDIPESKFLKKNDHILWEKAAESNRFKNIKISRCICRYDVEAETQFAAMTFELPGNVVYVAYRGTDDSLIGWKEDFNMSYMQSVPAQIEAKKYLEGVRRNFFTKIYVGGHSKGGNLAVYASIYCKNTLKNRIIAIYNNDGPGMLQEFVDKNRYNKVQNKIFTFLPETSIVGRLLDCNDNYTVVKSDKIFIMQHDPFSWQIEADKFEYAQDLDKDSKLINSTMTRWLKNITYSEREIFVNVIYNILFAADISNFKDIDILKICHNSKEIYAAYKNMEPENRKIFEHVVNDLLRTIRHSV